MAKKTSTIAVEKPRRKTGKKATTGVPSASRDTKGRARASKPQERVAPRAQAGTTRKEARGDGKEKKVTGLKRVASSVRGAISRVGKKVLHPRSGDGKAPAIAAKEPSRTPKAAVEQKAARVTKREADIPLDRIAQTYTPAQTSLKASFRSDGNDQHRDQEFAAGVADDVWNDEDLLTNKSGDPRIGTHNRTYEPGEARRASADKNR